jgi:phosphoglycolate phosphatase-like HAD superfamily hydrolase
MSSDPQHKLREFSPKHEFFVGIDSDGCVFNSMEVKHNDCFSVQVVRHFGLSAVSRQVHEAWDFVNLYSQNRGCNRFKALLWACDQLRAMPRVKQAGVQVPALSHLRAWTERESKLGNPTLAETIEQSAGEARDELSQVYAWSKDVNRFVEETVQNLPPFPLVPKSLQKLGEKADAMVISSTPVEALVREWSEHGIDSHVALIAGQEMGSKVEHLTLAAKGKYPERNILMIGDAPGDYKAARAIDALFFPINPGAEEASWERLHDEALDRFFSHSYAGKYEDDLVQHFMELLPQDPPWK